MENNNISPEQWLQIEQDEHDRHYKDSLPFDSKTYGIDVEHVIWWEDYCYKKGRRKDRGHRTKRVFELIRLRELDGKTILDIGCGNGQYSVFFALLGCKVYGIDISPVGIKVSKKIATFNNVADHCHFSVQSAANMNFDDSTFDIVIMHEVLHHAIKYPGVKKELLRVLKNGGIFICAESIHGNPFFKFGRFFTMRGKEAKGDIVMRLSDLNNFANDFSDHQIELMSLFFMSKRVFRDLLTFPPTRWFLHALKVIDDILIACFPILKKYCGEAILLAKK